jgi:hypothetical protein
LFENTNQQQSDWLELPEIEGDENVRDSSVGVQLENRCSTQYNQDMSRKDLMRQTVIQQISEESKEEHDVSMEQLFLLNLQHQNSRERHQSRRDSDVISSKSANFELNYPFSPEVSRS